ncbi:hypothetical protein PR002_g31274, partial [Phytophthora rubi]
MSSKKQGTLWAAFGRQRQPPAKRQKLQDADDVSVPRRKQSTPSEAPAEDADAVMQVEGGESDSVKTTEWSHVQLKTQEIRQPKDKLKLNERKEIMDSVHGLMTFEPICMEIIDTLQFQRLRSLHQLGAANYVYIGATHSRFEHCLGVAYLAEKMMESIRSHQPWLPITKEDILCIKIAGLCHDLGHGPFSHVFDGLFLDQLRKKKLISQSFKWSHEQGSVDMFDFLLA